MRPTKASGNHAPVKRHLDPVRRRPSGRSPESSGSPRGIVEVEAELEIGRALGAADAELAGLVPAAEFVVVIDRQRAAHPCRHNRGWRWCASAPPRGSGWPSVLAWTPCGIAEQLPDQVEIVDRMHGDLDARRP